MSSATSRVHHALDAFDFKSLASALASPSADVRALRPVDPGEQYIVFATPAEHRDGSLFALTALGRLASNLTSHMAARETGAAESKAERETGPRALALLLSAGADVSAPLFASRSASGGEWRASSSSFVDALRLMACARTAGRDDVRRARAAFLEPLVIATLAATKEVSALELVFWCAFGGGVAGALCAAGTVVRLPSGARVPQLIAAVDAGSVATVRALLEAGAAPDEPRAPGGLTALMRCAGACAFALPAPDDDISFGAHRRGANSDAGEGISAAAASAAVGVAAAAATSEDGTPLAESLAHRPTRALVECLINAGAAVDAVDDTRATALHHIATADSVALRSDPAGRLTLALRLVAAGARTDAKDANGRTPGEAAQIARPEGEGARFAARLIASAVTPSK